MNEINSENSSGNLCDVSNTHVPTDSISRPNNNERGRLAVKAMDCYMYNSDHSCLWGL